MDLMESFQETKGIYCRFHFRFYTSAIDGLLGWTLPDTIMGNSTFDLDVTFSSTEFWTNIPVDITPAPSIFPTYSYNIGNIQPLWNSFLKLSFRASTFYIGLCDVLLFPRATDASRSVLHISSV